MSEKTVTINGKKLNRADAEALLNAVFGEKEQSVEEEMERDYLSECEVKAHLMDCLVKRSKNIDCDSPWVFGYLDCVSDLFDGDKELPFDDFCDADCQNCPDKDDCEDSYT